MGIVLAFAAHYCLNPPHATAQRHVAIGWGWARHSASLALLEIQADRGDGKGFNLLTYDTTPGYNDTAPFPAAPVRWTYKAIYRVGDAQVGGVE